EMNLGLFYLWTFLGSLIFCSFLILLGSAFGAHLDTVIPLLRKGGLVVLGVAVAAVVIAAVVVRLRARPVRTE
ncbi:MAG TPA: hypothetical protein VGG70_00090, partial [Candidatus Cybelea sp.]